jgi:hypothetical protein
MKTKLQMLYLAKPCHSHLTAISTSTPKWLEIILEGYTQDEQTKQLLTELSLTGSNDKGFSLTDGIIKFKGRI